MLFVQVAEAIERKSSKLEVNDVKTKVRRLEALPEYDETTPSRTVVALNLPLERPTIEAVAEIFSVCGEIVLVRILRPGKLKGFHNIANARRHVYSIRILKQR